MDYRPITNLREGAQLLMSEIDKPALEPRIWEVGALCRAVADVLEARFNPVAVRGEISGFTRASSGHCYFSLKDELGQLRCAMFRRAASLMAVAPRDGDLVEVRGRLAVYEPRGDLQLIVESLSSAGQGALFEQFLRLKAQLEGEGLFDASRKRPIPRSPRAIGVVTSRGAAALHDVMTALRRRVPNVPVVLAPAQVQGASAPAELVRALSELCRCEAPVDVILLVRGGGSMEDLWAFNDQRLARAIVSSPIPVISGVGHETDFTIADFCADLRAPTPTAAAELAAIPRDQWLGAFDAAQQRLHLSLRKRTDMQYQRLDMVTARLGRPSGRINAQQLHLVRQGQRLAYGARSLAQSRRAGLPSLSLALSRAIQARVEHAREQLQRAELQLGLLDPRRLLERGYSMLTDLTGKAVSSARQVQPGQALRATLSDGEVDVTVTSSHLI